MNNYLRVIAEELGFNRLIYNDASPEGLPFYERLSAGVAVNTYIKNAIELETPPEVVSMITGVLPDSRIHRIKSDLVTSEIRKFDTLN
jgi:hypothetical protein